MLPSHADLILQQLLETDLVLDVGAWASPFNRAQWVLDSQPYETRGFYGSFGGPASQGGAREWFSRDTWVQRDICDRTPWPFADRSFDFVICSHTLEDIRDPLWVCSELMRVGKRGYIEVPSRAWESTLVKERQGMAGLSHHRWLIEITGDHIAFLPKWHMIHFSRRFHLPDGFPAPPFQWLWWDQRFTVEEREIHGLAEQEAELERFINGIAPCPPWIRRREALSAKVKALPRRLARRMRAAPPAPKSAV